MSEHTPTPWIDRDTEDCTHPVVDDPDFGSVRVMSMEDYAHAAECVNGMPAIRQQRDALLAACRAVREWFAEAEHVYGETEILDTLEAAIARPGR